MPSVRVVRFNLKGNERLKLLYLIFQKKIIMSILSYTCNLYTYLHSFYLHVDNKMFFFFFK